MPDHRNGQPANGPPTRARDARPASGTHAPLNYTAQRALRALEELAFSPASAAGVASAIGIHPRTARRLLQTLASDAYVVRSTRRPSVYLPTVRILALAAQLAERLPLVTVGRDVVAELARESGAGAALAVPSYDHVLVLASAGPGAPRPWVLIPARRSAVGHALLAARERWRESLGWPAEHRQASPLGEVAAVVRRGDDAIAAIGLWASGSDAGAAPLVHAACARLASRLE